MIGSMSCNKQTVVDTPTQVGISKIVFFPSVVINGARVVAFTAGGTFTDPGVTATLNGKPTTVVTSPTINSSTPAGVYTVTYTATNPQGYTASDWRYVVVVPASAANDATVQANDFSGTYLRAATGVTSTWTKIAAGVYQVENLGVRLRRGGLPYRRDQLFRHQYIHAFAIRSLFRGDDQYIECCILPGAACDLPLDI